MKKTIKKIRGEKTIEDFGVRFDESEHHFYDKDGNQIISVTKVTSIINKSTPLIYWATGLMGDYLLQEHNGKTINEEVVEIAKREWRKVKQEAADIGSAIHEWIEKYIKGEEQDMPADEKVLNGVKAFLDFQKENKFEWVLSEKKVYHPKFRYAGILDALAKTKDGYVLVDFKSSNGIYSEMALQLAAYDMALKEMIQWIKPKRYMIIRFGKNDGQFDWRDITHIINSARDGFLAALKLTNKLRQVEENLHNNGRKIITI